MKLSQEYWEDRYKNEQTGWQLNQVSPPIKAYVDQLENKNISILIPGAGTGFEAQYLHDRGFIDITVVDIAKDAIEQLQQRCVGVNAKKIKLVHQNFFDLSGAYDLVLEQTFFCALDPTLRKNYVTKMQELLNPSGKIVGLLFDRYFENSPPYGGSKSEYLKLFQEQFAITILEACYNSVPARQGSELFINFKKK